MDFTVEVYKGYGIDHDLFDMGEYSVQYCGDDCLFPTLESAKAFIDEVTKLNNTPTGSGSAGTNIEAKKGENTMTNKYFFLNSLTDADSIFGDQQPTCLDEAEVRRLSNEWERDLFEIMHEASDDEIAQWGTYNTTTEDDEPEEAVPYEVIESVSRGGQVIETTTPFCDAEKAVAFAKAQWGRMCDADKREATVYALECANQDPEAPDHFDGNTLWSSDEVGSLRLQFEATPDGNALSGENDSLFIRCTIEVPEGASEDYGYLTMKEAILSELTDAEKETVSFWYDGQEQHLAEDASADAEVDLYIERF